MKITKVSGIPLRCACAPISDALSTSFARQALLVKVETDTELYGIGEAFTYGAPLAAMKSIVEDELGPMLTGRDPSQIEMLWQTMYWRSLAHGRRGIVMGGISGIDIALWDLFGKMVHQPIARLLGQHYDRIPSYASGGFYKDGKGLDGLRAELESYRRKGYRDAKIKIGRSLDRPGMPLRYMACQDHTVTEEEDYQRIEAAKEIVGNGRLLVDTNASWNAADAVQKGKELVRLGVCWLEEPLPFEDEEGYRRLHRAVPELSLIGCETQQGLRNFEHMVKSEAIDILQPDVGWAGGISEVKKIGAMGLGAGRRISMHCFGSAVLFAAALQVAAAMANTEMMESEENPNPLKDSITKTPFEADMQMSFYVPEGDGLGIEIDWEKLNKWVVR